MVRILHWNFVHGFGHTYKFSTWNCHKNYDFCNTQILREYFRELAKHLWNTHLYAKILISTQPNWPGIHFTMITIQIQWKFHFDVILILMWWSHVIAFMMLMFAYFKVLVYYHETVWKKYYHVFNLWICNGYCWLIMLFWYIQRIPQVAMVAVLCDRGITWINLHG